jgi:hypothetical protein
MAGEPVSMFLAVAAAAQQPVSERMAALVDSLLKNIRKNADADTEKYRRILCAHQSFDLFWRAATLAGLERRMSRIGSKLVVQFDKLDGVVEALTGGRSGAKWVGAEVDNTVGIAAPFRLTYCFHSRSISLIGLPDKGKTIGGGSYRASEGNQDVNIQEITLFEFVE